MRYPRPLSPDPNDITSSAVPGCGRRNGNESLALVASDDPDFQQTGEGLSYSEDRDRSLVEPGLWARVMALRRLVASYESEMPLPRGMGNTNHLAAMESASDDTGWKTKRPSQGLETKDERRPDGGVLRRESLDISPVLDSDGRMTVGTDEARPPIRQKSLTERGRASTTQRRSASTSSRESFNSEENERSISEARASFSEGEHSSESSRSAGSEDGELRSDRFENQKGPVIRSSTRETDISVLSGLPGRQERGKGEDDSRGQNDAGDDPTAGGQDQLARGQNIHSLWGGDNTSTRAADLEAAAEEGRRLGLSAAAMCLDMDEEEATLSW